MIVHGRNLIIKAGGVAIAGAKSCTIDVKCEEIEVSGPTSGMWKQFIAGRRSWGINTSGLVVSKVSETIKMYSYNLGGEGYMSVNGVHYYGDEPGFTCFGCLQEGVDFSIDNTLSYDLQHPNGSLEQDLYYFLEDYQPGQYPSAIFISQKGKVGSADIDVWTIIKNLYGITFSNPSTGVYPSFALFHTPEAGTFFDISYNGRPVGFTHDYFEGTLVNSGEPLKQAIEQVGGLVELSAVVRGTNGEDVAVTGQAICTKFRSTGTVGNLLQGSFEFRGTGPLT